MTNLISPTNANYHTAHLSMGGRGAGPLIFFFGVKLVGVTGEAGAAGVPILLPGESSGAPGLGGGVMGRTGALRRAGGVEGGVP